MINALLTCRDRSARFNNNRDIAMIRTGKTRSADVDILNVHESTVDPYIYTAFILYMACWIRSACVKRQVWSALYSQHIGNVAIYFVCGRPGMIVVCCQWAAFIHAASGHVPRDLISQLPTLLECSVSRFLSFLSNWMFHIFLDSELFVYFYIRYRSCLLSYWSLNNY